MRHPRQGGTELAVQGVALETMHQGKSCESGVVIVQGTVLDGHKLALQLSMRKLSAAHSGKQDGKAIAKGKGTKLVVRNVAFEATRKDLTALFTPFGQIKSCRLPKKMDGNHRCFNLLPLKLQSCGLGTVTELRWM